MFVREVVEKLDNPTLQVDRSLFRDRNGNWAKDWSEVSNVFIEFSDSTTFIISPAEFKSLTREQQTKVRNAPSSPKP